MSISRRLARMVGMSLASLLTGCVTSSIRPDLARVGELSHTPSLGRSGEGGLVTDRDPDAGLSPETLALLREPLDAEAAVRVALLNHRELRAELQSLGIARGRLLQAGLPANPVVELEVLPERDSAIELRVEQDVTSLLLAPLRARAAEADLETARFKAAREVIAVGQAVRTAFYALQSAEKRLALSRQALDTFAAGREASEALLSAGNIADLDAAMDVAAHERARMTVAELELLVADRREQLQPLLGLFGKDTQWRAQQGLSPVPEGLPGFEKVEARAVEASLDLRAAQSEMAAIAGRAGLTRAEGWIPEVAVDLHALHTRAEDTGAAGTPGLGESWRVGGGVSVSVPLFDRKQGLARAHDAELAAAKERYSGLALTLRSEVRRAKNRLVSAHARARRYESVVIPAQRAVIEQTLLHYNAMQVGLKELLAARRELLAVETAHVETVEEYWSAKAALDALLAGCLTSAPAARTMSTMSAAETDRGGH